MYQLVSIKCHVCNLQNKFLLLLTNGKNIHEEVILSVEKIMLLNVGEDRAHTWNKKKYRGSVNIKMC